MLSVPLIVDRAGVGDRVEAAARATILQVDRAFLLFNVPVFEKLLELKIRLKLIVPVLLKVPELVEAAWVELRRDSDRAFIVERAPLRKAKLASK